MGNLLEVLDQAQIDEAYLVHIPGWTEESYFDRAPESRFVEFEDGDLIMHSPVNIAHQEIVGFVAGLLRLFVEERKAGRILTGPAVVRLRPDLDYEPDIFVVAPDQLQNLGQQYFSGAPRLVIEVISPGTRSHDLKIKAQNYGKHGVPEYWAIDYAKKVVTLHSSPSDAAAPYNVTQCAYGRVVSQQIPGFWLEVQWLWENPLPNTLECLRLILRKD